MSVHADNCTFHGLQKEGSWKAERPGDGSEVGRLPLQQRIRALFIFIFKNADGMVIYIFWTCRGQVCKAMMDECLEGTASVSTKGNQNASGGSKDLEWVFFIFKDLGLLKGWLDRATHAVIFCALERGRGAPPPPRLCPAPSPPPPQKKKKKTTHPPFPGTQSFCRSTNSSFARTDKSAAYPAAPQSRVGRS